jgi:glycosyltransferase involved in cell wall biosynthesis
MTSKSVCLIVTAEITATTFYRGYLGHLRRMGWDVSLIASSDGNLEDFGRREGVNVISVPMRREPSPLNDLMSLVRLIKQIAQLRPDVVVTATPKAGLLGTFAALVTRVPVRVYQLWGVRFETESGPRRTLLKLLEVWSVSAATQVIANSPSLARRAAELGLTRKKPAVVLGPGSSHGVDLTHFSPAVDVPSVDGVTSRFLASRPDDMIVGFVGRVHPDKGIETLLKALEILNARGLPLRLLVVGAFESDAIVTQVRQSSVDTHLVGPVIDTRPYLKAMDIHCLPTRREGFPNVVLEASALSLATVASDATGAVDSVIDGETGLLFPTDDAHALATRLERLARDAEMRSRLGQRARAHVEKNFSKETIWCLQEENLRRQMGLVSA